MSGAFEPRAEVRAGGETCAEVAVALPVRGRFHYRISDGLSRALEVGHRVVVPFGGRRVVGFVLGLSPPPEGLELRTVEALLDDEPALPADVLALAELVSDYYLAPLGEVLKAALPPSLSKAPDPRYVATAAGRRLLESYARDALVAERLGPKERKVLDVCARGEGARVVKTPARVAQRLLERDLIRRRDVTPWSEDEADVEIVERTLDPRGAYPKIQRGPRKKALYALLGSGPVDLDVIVARHGRRPTTTALLALERDGIVRRRRVPRRAAPAELPPWSAPDLTAEQRAAVDAVAHQLGGERAFLLQGVTGSGKTEVYLHAIREARAKGRGAIVLVPEIGLTPQLEARFVERFGARVVVLHSGLTPLERRRRWLALRRGEAQIALGPRSAVWAPVRDLGLIVVDEEHDGSYKQGSDVRYHGRDVALMRARIDGAVTVLGSATPSLEAYELVERGRAERLRLSGRPTGGTLPSIELVDLALEPPELRLVSRPLRDALADAVRAEQQAILFLNRRGFHTVVLCGACREPHRCPSCDVSMTLHQPLQRLRCHYCGFTEVIDAPCRACGEVDPFPIGAGTQRVVDELQQIVPDAAIGRLDRDAATTAKQVQDVLSKFRRGETRVLVGTKMVTKGHDFPRVTLVGILQADASMAFPDFRALEQTFQLLTQVAGRAGRGDQPGRVIIQTYQPDHPVFDCALDQDPDRFFELEAPSRRAAGFPPYGRAGLVRSESDREADARAWADQLATEVRRHQPSDGSVRILGPTPAPLARLQGRYRHRFLVLADTPARLRNALSRVPDLASDAPRGTTTIVDIDAHDFL